MARKNTQQAVDAWINGRVYRAKGRNGSPIHTCGGVLYSYNKAIGKWSDADGKTAILNIEGYSVTTSCQQNGVRSLLIQKGYTFIPCLTEEMFRNTSR